MSEPLITRREAAQVCGVSEDAFVKTYEPAAGSIRIGRCVRFRPEDVRLAKEAVPLARALVRKDPPQPKFRRRSESGIWYVRFARRGRTHEYSTGEVDIEKARVVGLGIWFRAHQELTEEGPGVYVVRSGASMKVGRSTRAIRLRVNELQIAQPEPLELLAILSANPDDEKAAHARLAPFHERGEWYRVTAESLRIVLRMVTHGVEDGP